MPKFVKPLLFLLLFSLILPLSVPQALAEAPAPPSLSAHSAVLLDAAHGTVIFEKDANRRLPMASTTKIMTALVALEQMSPETEIEIPAAAVGVEGSSVYLVEGEVLTLEELLYAVLLESANDASVAVAVAVGGSVEGFAELMNQKAAALGLSDTQFQNPHGLDAEGHYTTARELALIARAALQNEHLRQIVSTRKTTIPHGGTDGVRLLVNHNKLLRLYPGAIGVKTGYTKRSGRTLVSAAEREGLCLIAVTLNASDDWRDHAAMLDYGFALWQSLSLCQANGVCIPLPVVGGVADRVVVSNSTPLSVSLPREHPPLTQIVELPRFLYAPIADGAAVGRVLYCCDLDGDGVSEPIASTPLTVQVGVSALAKPSLWKRLLLFFGV